MIRSWSWVLLKFSDALLWVCHEHGCWPAEVIGSGKRGGPAAMKARHELILAMRNRVAWRWEGKKKVYCDPGEGGPIGSTDLVKLVGLSQPTITQFLNRNEMKRITRQQKEREEKRKRDGETRAASLRLSQLED